MNQASSISVFVISVCMIHIKYPVCYAMLSYAGPLSHAALK